ncbi:hypothetical protein PRZ48_011157 [Zasmidium cellare]|uniref:BTB domain-containing protein n=1 Tax=Zasmidium cellare TaxID=395010 RepID=A0ABR0EAM2_ZASCE|nr:hypothetical protein PRZ48_011157 [Zasmidium cellare]
MYAFDQECLMNIIMGSMSAVIDGVRGLYLDTRYADLEIRCPGKRFKVHRAIVCPRSKVLDRECSSGFEGISTKIIQHAMFNAATMDRMPQFIYCGEYSTKAGT